MQILQGLCKKQNELYSIPDASTKRRNHHLPCHAEFISASAVDEEPRMVEYFAIHFGWPFSKAILL